jgi:hypothetical protein
MGGIAMKYPKFNVNDTVFIVCIESSVTIRKGIINSRTYFEDRSESNWRYTHNGNTTLTFKEDMIGATLKEAVEKLIEGAKLLDEGRFTAIKDNIEYLIAEAKK